MRLCFEEPPPRGVRTPRHWRDPPVFQDSADGAFPDAVAQTTQLARQKPGQRGEYSPVGTGRLRLPDLTTEESRPPAGVRVSQRGPRRRCRRATPASATSPSPCSNSPAGTTSPKPPDTWPPTATTHSTSSVSHHENARTLGWGYVANLRNFGPDWYHGSASIALTWGPTCGSTAGPVPRHARSRDDLPDTPRGYPSITAHPPATSSPRPPPHRPAGSSRTMTDLDVGVLLTSAVESSGTNTLVSGK